MEDVGHSALLKFLVGGETKMSETSNIKSEVPGEQKLREGGTSGDNENPTLDPNDKAQSSLQEASSSEVTTAEDFTLEPVITVTKQESTFTKGELKLQKVTVTEDISLTSEETETSGSINRRLTYEIHTKIPSPTNAASKRDDTPISTHTTEKANVESRKSKTKIPMTRFRQAVDKVKREQKEIRKTKAVPESAGTHRKSSIPRLKDAKIPHQFTTKDTKISKEENQPTAAVEDEFDKIFREINEKDSSVEASISTEDCVSRVEDSFDEIIHAYEEGIQEKVQIVRSDRVRQSRIPMLKRKSEHDIEKPRNRERYTIKKSLSVDMGKDDIPGLQTELTSETLSEEESQGYAETSTESVIFRSETSYSTECNTKKRQGIKCDENVYDRILITDETFNEAEARYRLSKYRQGIIDNDITEAVPIINEPEVTTEASDVTESYDDTSMTSETQLTKISSEQVRFDKQIVSKIYKIDFTENTFDLADSETIETSNGHIQKMAKEEASNEAITSSISNSSSISVSVDHHKTENVVDDFIVSKFKAKSNKTTHDYKYEQDTTKSYSIKSVQTSVTTNKGGQREELTKVNTKNSIETPESDKDYSKHEVTHQGNATTNVTESTTIEPAKEFEDTDKNIVNSVTTCSSDEIKESTVEDFTTRENTLKMNGTEKTAPYLSSKHSTNTKDAKSSDDTKKRKSINDLIAKYSRKETKDSTTYTTNSVYKHKPKEIRESSYAHAGFIKSEIKKETEHTESIESEFINKDIAKHGNDIGNSASVLVRNVSKELKKGTQNNEMNSVVIQNVIEMNHEKTDTSGLYVNPKSEDLAVTTINTANLIQSIKETKITSNLASNKSEVNEIKITNNNFCLNNETDSQAASLRSPDTTKHSNAPFTNKPTKPEVNGKEIDHDEETIKIYTDVFSKLLAVSKVSTEFKTKTEISQGLEEASTKSSIDGSPNLTVPDSSNLVEDIHILKGKVSSIVRQINTPDNSKIEEKELGTEVPKKKSILSKIALFERDEPYEPIPKPKPPQPEPKLLRGLAALRQTSAELRKPKIIDEIYKDYSERETVQGSTKLTSEKDEEEITIDIKDVKNNDEVNRFDSAFKTKLNEINTVKDEQDISKTEYFYTHKDIENKNEEDENNEEEITIEIKDITSETNVPLSNSTYKSKLYEYNTYKYDALKRGKSESYLSQAERRTEEKRLGESSTLNSSASDLLYGINESKSLDIINTDEVLTVHYESSSKINNTTTSNSSTISEEASNDFKRTVSSPANLVDDQISTETNNTPKMSGIWKVNERDQLKKSIYNDVTRNEEVNEKMTKRVRRRDPILQRAISVVEDDLNDVIKGKVKGIISRINSMEQIELTRKRNQEKNRPWASVSERIALFEGKASKAKAEKSIEGRSWRNKAVETAPKEMDNETFMKRLAELKEAKKTYGFTKTNYMELRDGAKMPVISLGTALLDKRLVRQIVETAIDLGYRAIDTAFIYDNEKEVGEGINAKINDGTVKREELFIISKLWSTFHRRDLVERACRSSLEKLGLTYFDLYLIHNPMSLKEGGDPIPKIANVLQFSEHDFMDAWFGIEDLVSKGLVKSAGLSNFNSEQVHRVTEKGRLKPVVNQVECHPYLSQDRLAGFCDAYGMKLVCFGTLGSKGTPKALRSTLLPVIDDPLVQVMAAGLGVSPAQLLLAFQMKKGRGVVTKASSASHLHENLSAQRLTLETSQLTALGALDRHKRTYTFEGMGETHKNYPFNIAF